MEEALCEVCSVGKKRYKCPGCGIRSCGVQCVKKHKSENGCEGKRMKTNYVSLSEFTTSQLLSDYHFLEEAGRIIDSAHRGFLTIGRDTRDRRQKLQRVRTAARKSGISLHLLPHGMSRHNVNTSCTVWNKERRDWGIEWRVRLVFPQADHSITEERVSEDMSVENLLKRYIHPSESNPVIRHRLRVYVGQEVAVFLKLEKTNSYCQLQPHTSFRQCLRNKTIIEFPELHITLSSAAANYQGHPPQAANYQGTPQPAGVPSQLTGEEGSKDTISSLAKLAVNYGSSGEDEM